MMRADPLIEMKLNDAHEVMLGFMPQPYFPRNAVDCRALQYRAFVGEFYIFGVVGCQD